jgi:hypothetical protein
MPSYFQKPGLKKRRNKDGTVHRLWLARTDLVNSG